MMTNILSELLPRKVRLGLYVFFAAASGLYAAWEASSGDWTVFTGAALAALVNILAAGNVNQPSEEGDG